MLYLVPTPIGNLEDITIRGINVLKKVELVLAEDTRTTGKLLNQYDIEAALKELPERQRKVFQMIKIEGYTAKEVANEMGMSVSAVKVSAHRTMVKLKGRLAE